MSLSCDLIFASRAHSDSHPSSRLSLRHPALGHFSRDKSRVDRPDTSRVDRPTRHPIAFAFDTLYLKWRRKEPPLHFSRASLSNWDFIRRRNHNFQINYNVKWQHINAKYCIGVSRGVDIYEILMNEIVHASSIIILLSTSFSTLNG
jgi:hypothetical protein